MNHYYQNKKKLFFLSPVFLLLAFFSSSVFSQTTISTETGTDYTGGNGLFGNGFITFVIENTNTTAISFNQVDAFWRTTQTGSIPELWYSSTSLSGAPTVTSPDWTLITTGTALTIPADDYYTTLSGLNFQIPAGAQYRFALKSTNGISYSGSGTVTPTPNIFSAGGVNLKVGDNQITALNIGYAGIFPNGVNNPRFFTGRIVFGDPPTGPPSCATDLSPANNATNVPTTTSLTWTAAAGASSYDVYLGTASNPALVGTVNNQTSYTISPVLTTNTLYYYRIVPKNNFGSATGCPTISFTTSANVSYCTPGSSDCSLSDEILNVTVGALNNSSNTCSPSGYIDYTGVAGVSVPDLSAGATIPMTVQIGPGGDDSVGVWVDYNKDGIFSATEYTFFGGSDAAATLSGNLNVPAGATQGNTRMRVRVKYGSAVFNGNSACTTLTYGETEDYAVNITTAASCAQPIGLVAKSITATSDSIRWNKITAATNYEYAVTTSATPPASGTATASNNDTAILATGLIPETQYYAHVRSNCGSGNFSNWATLSFSTVRVNDLCTDATDVTSKIGINIADTVGKATLVTAGFEGSPANAICSGIASGGINDVWYKFTAPANGDSVIITGASGSSSDWVYQLFASCGGAQLACSDDADDNPFGNTAMPLIGVCGLQSGTTYYVRAFPFSPGVTKTCRLYIYSGGTCPTPPANDGCANAVDISASCNAPIAGTTVNADPTSSLANSSCGGLFATQSDVWYKFNTGNNIILPTIKITNIDTADGSKDVYLSVYHGSDCNNLAYDGCLVRPDGSDSIIAFIAGVNSNQDYFVRIYSTSTLSQTTFNISLCDSTSILKVDTTGQSACNGWGSITINAANQNNNTWVRLLNSGVMAEINANGQNLGSTSINLYRNISGSIRRDDSRTLPLLGREYMDRNITITPTTQPTAPVSVRIYFTNQELNDLIAAGGDGYADVAGINNLVITKNQQACGAALVSGNGEVLIAQTGNGTFADGAYVEFSVSSFSTFFLNGGSVPVPVNLLSFNAQRTGRVNNISWSTAQELNTRVFIVERSTNGRDYSPIGQVTAAGNSNTTRSYSFIDNAPAKGINYYRIRIVDVDNSSKFSNIRNVRNEGTADITMYPNPVKDRIQLNITSDKADRATITIVDISGKLVYSKATNLFEGPNNLNINTSNLKSGSYIIKVQLTDDLVVKKFNKL